MSLAVRTLYLAIIDNCVHHLSYCTTIKASQLDCLFPLIIPACRQTSKHMHACEQISMRAANE